MHSLHELDYDYLRSMGKELENHYITVPLGRYELNVDIFCPLTPF